MNFSKFRKGFLLLLLPSLFFSSEWANAGTTAGGVCSKAGATSVVGDVKYTCVQSGKKLVWNSGVKVTPAVAPVDYSQCIQNGTYSEFWLRQGSYSNVGQTYNPVKGWGPSDNSGYVQQLINKVQGVKFGFNDFSFTNNSPCNVSIQLSGEAVCYFPLTNSPNLSHSIRQTLSLSGSAQVASKQTQTINIRNAFPYESRVCELKKTAGLVGYGPASYLAPYLSFGNDISKVFIRITGTDPRAVPRTPEQIAADAQASLSCATGGVCRVGMKGPGGGYVFYDAGSQKSWGRFLEMAPPGWNGTELDPKIAWCDKTNPLYPAITDASLKSSLGLEIGKGKADTAFMLSKCSSGAALLVQAYKGGGKDDWFLPSKGELNELCKFAKSQATGNVDVRCSKNGGLLTGFYPYYYWSSSESEVNSYGEINSWSIDFNYANENNVFDKKSESYVRPIRAF